MQIKNTHTRFGLGSIFFHWVMAVLVIGMLIVGLYMTSLPQTDPERLKFYGWHKQTGMLVLMLAVLRVVWRNLNQNPSLDNLPAWERISARATHYLLYLLMFAMPLTGWLLSSAAGYPISFFGLGEIPTIIPTNDEYRHLFAELHEWIGFTLIGVIALHVAAAFKHHWIDKDDILKRML